MKNLQWLLTAHKPACRLGPKWRVRTERTTGYLGISTVKEISAIRWRLGYPKRAINGPVGRDLIRILRCRVRRPPKWVARSVDRLRPKVPPPYASGTPLSRRPTLCGTPGAGTHSYRASPNNWQSDRALDLCVAYGTIVFAVQSGRVCGGYGDPGRGGRFAGSRLTICGRDSIYYTHLQRDLRVRPGQFVQRGWVIGFTNFPGLPHLHIACRSCNPYTLWRR